MLAMDDSIRRPTTMSDSDATVNRRRRPKTKTGCPRCKKRKIKCDEQRPSCRNCIKHNVPCDFVRSKSHAISPSSSSVGLSCQQPYLALNPNDGFGQGASANMDFMLLHHYTTSTYYTLCTETTLRDFWRITVPQIGFETPYVLRGLLSLAALHMARYDTQRKEALVSQAMMHHNASLAEGSSLLLNVNAQNCGPLFLFSTITAYFALGKAKDLHDFLLVKDNDIPIWLSLFRGARLLLSMEWETLKESALLPLFHHGEQAHRLWLTGRCEVPALDELTENIRISLSEADPETWRHLVDAIDALKRSFAIAYDTKNTVEVGFRGVSIWLVKVSDEFLTLVKERQSEALCVLGFFAALLKRTEHTWWTEGWGVHLISAVYSLLDQSYKLWIRWPIEEIGWVPYP